MVLYSSLTNAGATSADFTTVREFSVNFACRIPNEILQRKLRRAQRELHKAQRELREPDHLMLPACLYHSSAATTQTDEPPLCLPAVFQQASVPNTRSKVGDCIMRQLVLWVAFRYSNNIICRDYIYFVGLTGIELEHNITVLSCSVALFAKLLMCMI